MQVPHAMQSSLITYAIVLFRFGLFCGCKSSVFILSSKYRYLFFGKVKGSGRLQGGGTVQYIKASHVIYAVRRVVAHILSVAFLLVPALLQWSASDAQERKIQNRPFLDDRVWHYGFLVGLNVQDMRLANNGTYTVADGGTLETWYADVPEYIPGFSVGILGEIKATENISFRLIPTMHFGDRKVVFREQYSGRTQEQFVKSTLLSFPVDMKISGLRYNNYRPYFVAGLAPTADITVKKGHELLIKKGDMFFEVGMGVDLYYPFFKMIPELKFCFGLNDILVRNRTDLKDVSMLKYSNSLQEANSRMIVLTLYFE